MARTSRQQHRTEIFDRIVTTGMTAFEQTGFDDTKIADIAALAGISERTIYRYFPNKGDIVYAPLLPNIRSIVEHLCDIPSDVPIADAMRLSMANAIEQQETDRQMFSRHIRLIGTSRTLIAFGKAVLDVATKDLRNEIARRMGIAKRSVIAEMWSTMATTLLFGADEQWLLHPNQPLKPIVTECIAALRDFSAMMDELSPPEPA